MGGPRHIAKSLAQLIAGWLSTDQVPMNTFDMNGKTEILLKIQHMEGRPQPVTKATHGALLHNGASHLPYTRTGRRRRRLRRHARQVSTQIHASCPRCRCLSLDSLMNASWAQLPIDLERSDRIPNISVGGTYHLFAVSTF